MFGSVKSRVVLFLLSAGAVFTPLAEAQQETLTGWFAFIVADYPPESGLDPETTYTLTEDSGERHELLIDVELMQPLGGLVAVNRKRVTVEGEWESSGAAAPEQFRVSSIHLDPLEEESRPLARGYQTLQATSETAVTGSQAWVTILCRFADATDETPYPVEHYETIMEGLDPYWREVSYGNINLTGSVVVGWYNLPQPQSYYYEGAEDYDWYKTAEDCTAAADRDVFFPDFDGVNIVFNRDFDSRPKGGFFYLTLDGQDFLRLGMTWLPLRMHDNPYIWAHEMGHGFGLLHSSGPYDRTYDSQWDVMSAGGFCWPPYPESDCLAVHTIAYHKDLLGWIPPDRKYMAAPNSTQTITLERVAQPGAEGYLMAQIPIGESGTDFYTIEARLFAGYDEEIPGEAVIIHKVDTTRRDRLAQVVDVDNNGDPNDDGAMWTVGETFTDPANGMQVSVDAEHASGFRVTIDYTICSEVLSPHQLLGGRGGNARVRVRAPSGCRWTATSHSPWIMITMDSGSGDGRISYTVEENPSLNARTGTLIIGGQTFTVVQAGVNGNLFEDDMESGVNGWSRCGDWMLATASSHSGTHAWTWSGEAHCFLNSPVIDLTRVESATLTFWHRFNLVVRGSFEVHTIKDWQYTEIKRFRGTQGWTQVSLDLSPFVGQAIRLSFYKYTIVGDEDAKDTWSIDDVVVSSSDFDTPTPTQATLENPSAGSSQSGIGIISGWACHAHEIVIELAGTPVPAAYGTPRGDTQGVCGDSNNGFSLLVNWNELGAGEHTIRALADGVEFARTTVRVTTLGAAFLEDVQRTVIVPDFPHPGDATTLQWEESRQNFLITDGQPSKGGGHNRVAGLQAVLENPSLGSSQSGIGIISGWGCEAGEIVIELAGTPIPAAYGTPRGDTQSACGDSNNGFVLLVNWNELGAGEHAIRALADGVEFARTTVRVTTLGVAFLEDVQRTVVVPDFPHSGDTTTLRWEESLQNFTIIP